MVGFKRLPTFSSNIQRPQRVAPPPPPSPKLRAIGSASSIGSSDAAQMGVPISPLSLRSSPSQGFLNMPTFPAAPTLGGTTTACGVVAAASPGATFAQPPSAIDSAAPGVFALAPSMLAGGSALGSPSGASAVGGGGGFAFGGGFPGSTSGGVGGFGFSTLAFSPQHALPPPPPFAFGAANTNTADHAPPPAVSASTAAAAATRQRKFGFVAAAQHARMKLKVARADTHSGPMGSSALMGVGLGTGCGGPGSSLFSGRAGSHGRTHSAGSAASPLVLCPSGRRGVTPLRGVSVLAAARRAHSTRPASLLDTPVHRPQAAPPLPAEVQMMALPVTHVALKEAEALMDDMCL